MDIASPVQKSQAAESGGNPAAPARHQQASTELTMSEGCGLRRRRRRGSTDASAEDQDATSHALRYRRTVSDSYHLRTATSQVCTQ